MDIKITKKEILQDINNEMNTYKTYLVHAKITNSNNTWSKKLKFIYTIEKNEIFEYVDKAYLTQQEQKEITNEILYFALETYNTDKDTSEINDFKNALTEMIDYCNYTIHEYNKARNNFYY